MDWAVQWIVTGPDGKAVALTSLKPSAVHSLYYTNRLAMDMAKMYKTDDKISTATSATSSKSTPHSSVFWQKHEHV
jgi:hypothetical protein